ncbi:MAG: hypothetical protein RAK24_02175 [TACK group archaeon]|nr:hypothetical protein [TACK group archaeon]
MEQVTVRAAMVMHAKSSGHRDDPHARKTSPAPNVIGTARTRMVVKGGFPQDIKIFKRWKKEPKKADKNKRRPPCI